jgi:copper transport protein
MRRSAAILGLIFTISAFGVSGAFAHAQVEATSPLKGAVLTTSPQLVWVQFGENLLVLDKNHINSVTVANSSGKRMDNSRTITKGTKATVKLKGILAAGKYVVKYRAVSEDGHVVSGSYNFSVK